jgi:hypothetical protein
MAVRPIIYELYRIIFFLLSMSLTKEIVKPNIEKILYNNKPASLTGTIIVKDLSKTGWIVIDCSRDNKISRGLINVANQLNVKINVNLFYSKYDGSVSLSEGKEYNIIAEVYLSKGTTLYCIINKLNPILSSSSNISSLSDSISITNVDKSSTKKTLNENISNIDTTSQKLSGPITLSDETINKIKLVMKEAFSEVLIESTKNLSMLVEVIKELTVVIDNKDKKKQKNLGSDIKNKKESPFISKDNDSLSHDKIKDELFDTDLPNDDDDLSDNDLPDDDLLSDNE